MNNMVSLINIKLKRIVKLKAIRNRTVIDKYSITFDQFEMYTIEPIKLDW